MKAKITYTTPDGEKHCEVVTLAVHPIIAVDKVSIQGANVLDVREAQEPLPEACLSSPLMHVEWRPASSLKANHWNPNFCMTPELHLLERSLLVTNWVQPILITPAGTIIDGFHRNQLSMDSPALVKRFGGMVPCAVIDISEAQAKMLTVRMNRAKGTHGALRMSELVHSLIDEHGCDPAEVAVEIGATADEVALLYQDSVFTQRNIKDYKYSKSWIPVESKTRI